MVATQVNRLANRTGTASNRITLGTTQEVKRCMSRS